MSDNSIGEGRVRQANVPSVRETISAAAELGMFFQLIDTTEDPTGWLPVSQLYSADDHSSLSSLVQTVQLQLKCHEPRVAASIFFLGYASRLLSPQLAGLACAQRIPNVAASRLSWRRPPDQLIQLGYEPVPGWEGNRDVLLDKLIEQTASEHLLPLSQALRARVTVAEGLLRGNAASALMGALLQLRTVLGDRWHPLAGRALGSQWLQGSGVLRAGPPVFVRRSCCLYYRIPGGGLCGDCPLPPARRGDGTDSRNRARAEGALE